MSEIVLFDELLETFAQCLDADSAQRVIDFGITDSLRTRIELVAKRANEGALSEDEQADYEALVNAADFIAKLKPMAQRKLTANGRI
jgi:hypothetical protein